MFGIGSLLGLSTYNQLLPANRLKVLTVYGDGYYICML